MQADTTIPDYILFFNIYNDTLDYTGSLPMSEQGKVLEHFNFPNTGKTGMFSLISEKDALAIAYKESKTEGKLTANFQYDNNGQIFIWVVDVMAKNSNVTHKYNIITINAETGKVLEQREGIFYSY